MVFGKREKPPVGTVGDMVCCEIWLKQTFFVFFFVVFTEDFPDSAGRAGSRRERKWMCGRTLPLLSTHGGH